MCNIEMPIFIMRVDEFLCKFTFISKISKEMRLYILVYKVFCAENLYVNQNVDIQCGLMLDKKHCIKKPLL